MDIASQEYSFSEPVLQMLVKAGWFPERRIDVTAMTQHLEHEGYSVFPVVRTFLTTFGGLQVRAPDTTLLLHFAADDAAAQVYGDATRALFQEIYGKNVCVIGEYTPGSDTLLLDASGACYSVYAPHTATLGQNANAMIERLLAARVGGAKP